MTVVKKAFYAAMLSAATVWAGSSPVGPQRCPDSGKKECVIALHP